MPPKKRKESADGLDAVYLGDFEGFVARRDALAKQLKGSGEDDAAAAVKALKKPSRTAWAVNQFAAHGKKLRTDLLKAGGELRAVQEGLVSGDGDREAMLKARDHERAAVSKALEAITALAADAGPALNDAATDRVRQTLHAVALDDGVRDQFEAARLTADHEASGLGGATGAAPKPSKARDASKKRRRREELKAAEAEAAKRTRKLEDAEDELREAEQRHENAKRAAAEAAERVAALRGG